MDWGEIIKRAFSISWRNKNLWWLGLFAAAGGGGGMNLSRTFDSKDFQNADAPWNWGPMPTHLPSEWLPWVWGLIAVAVLLVILGIVFFVVQIAATGGLVAEVDRADAGGRPSASAGWREGFARWWRLLGLSLLVALPFILFGALFALMAFFAFVSAVPFGTTSDVSASGVTGWIGLVLVFGLLLIPVALVLGVISQFGIRSIMLEDAGVGRAFSNGWWLVRHRFKYVALGWLIAFGLGIGFGVVIGVLALIVIVPAVLFIAGIAISGGGDPNAWIAPAVMGAVFALVMGVVFWVISAAFNTFSSAFWTIFWLRLTGRRGAPAPVWAQPPAPTWQAPVPPAAPWTPGAPDAPQPPASSPPPATPGTTPPPGLG